MKIKIDFEDKLFLDYLLRGRAGLFQFRVENDNIFYPSNNWEDFGEIVLGWWIVSLGNAIKGFNNQKLQFMDGPHSIEIIFVRESKIFQLLPDITRTSWIKQPINWHISAFDLVQEFRDAVGQIQQKRLSLGLEENSSLSEGKNLLGKIEKTLEGT